MKARCFIVPMRVIPEHYVTRCEDCPDFVHRGGSWGEYHACLGNHNWFDDDIHRNGQDIPDNCPRLDQKGELK